MAETRETQVLEDAVESTEIENPRTTEEAILAKIIAGEEVNINARTRYQYWLKQLKSGGSLQLVKGEYTLNFNGSESILVEPPIGYDGFSDFNINVSWSITPYERIPFSSSDVANMVDWFDIFSEELPLVGSIAYGVLSMAVNSNLLYFPIEVTKRGDATYSLFGGAINGGIGAVFSFTISEESCVCNTLYQIANGSITDLTAMASSILSDFAGGIWVSYD